MKAKWKYLTPEQQANFGNGCGPASFEKYVPEFTFNGACRKHDFHYRIYGPVLTKMYYDLVMLVDCWKASWTQNGWLGAVFLGFMAFLYWWYLFLSTPYYAWCAWKITKLKPRTLEEMAKRYHFKIDKEFIRENFG